MNFQSLPTKSWAVFIITAPDLNPDEVTTKIRLTPDYFQEPSLTDSGDNIPGIWQMNSTISEELELEEQIWDLLKKIAPVRKEVKEVIEKFTAYIYCSIEFSDKDRGGFKFTPRLLNLLANLGAPIQIHPYNSQRSVSE
jgi:hypothetical protein